MEEDRAANIKLFLVIEKGKEREREREREREMRVRRTRLIPEPKIPMRLTFLTAAKL